MHRLVSQFSVLLLCLFSVTITILVWSNVGSTTTESILLSIAAMGIEMAKYVLIPSALILWQRESGRPLSAVCVVLMVCVVLVSVGTMVTYFDSRVTQQKSIIATQLHTNAINQRIVKQQLDANDVIISAGKKFVSIGHITSGTNTANSLNTDIIINTNKYTPSLFTGSLPDDPFNRKVLLAVIALAIDCTSMVLISMLFLTSAKTITEKEESKFTGHPLEKIRNEILAGPKNEPINVSEIKILHNIDRRKIDQLVGEMHDSGEVRKQSNRYYLAV